MRSQAKAIKGLRLYGRLIKGAKVHAKALRFFERKPDEEPTVLFERAKGKQKLTENQEAFLKRSLEELRRAQQLVEKEGFTSQRVLTDLLTSAGFGKQIERLLERYPLPELKAGPFGLVLVINDTLFREINARISRIPVSEEVEAEIRGSTIPRFYRLTQPDGKVSKIPLTILPESSETVDWGPLTKAHEKEHRITYLLRQDQQTRRTRQPEFNRIHDEFVSYIKGNSSESLATFLLYSLKKDPRTMALSNPDKNKILVAYQAVEKAEKIMPRNQLVEIIRTTPLEKIYRRLTIVMDILEERKKSK